MPHNLNADLSELVHAGGSLSRVLAEFPIDEIEATKPGPRMRSITRALETAGSSPSDIATITAALEEHSPNRNLVPRFLLARGGSLLVDEFLPGTELHGDEAGYDELPNLIPLLIQRQTTVPYILLEASAGGGRIRTYLAARTEPDRDDRLVGETEHLHEAHGGGLSHRRHAHHTEEIWKRNETELADAVNQSIERNVIRLLIVTGDPHVVELVASALSSRAREVVVTLDMDTLADGASTDALDALLADSLERIVRARQTDAIGRAAAQLKADHSRIDQRLQPIVHALQQAGVDTLLLDLDASAPHSLLALDGEPWIASVPTETFGAAILQATSAAQALARAAIATDADVIFVDHGTLPGHAAATIVHR